MASMFGVSKTLLRGARRGVMSSKQGNKHYYKGCFLFSSTCMRREKERQDRQTHTQRERLGACARIFTSALVWCVGFSCIVGAFNGLHPAPCVPCLVAWTWTRISRKGATHSLSGLPLSLSLLHAQTHIHRHARHCLVINTGWA